MRGACQSAAFCTHLDQDQTHNPGMCPDQESNGDLSVCGTTPSPQSHTRRGWKSLFKWSGLSQAPQFLIREDSQCLWGGFAGPQPQGWRQ